MAWDRSGVPGAPARTSWYDRDLPAMWRVLENQQSDDHWRLVIGWRKAAELTATHLRRLEQYRANLAEVWPPDRNTAAAAYVARLDFLIQNVRTTHEVAAANYSTLAATVGALASARRDLKPLHDEYVAKSRALQEYTDLAALNAAAEAPTVIGAAPASSQDLERLNSRGRAIMYTLSHTLVEAEAAIRQPPTYEAVTNKNGGDPNVYGTTAKEPRLGRHLGETGNLAQETVGGARSSAAASPSKSGVEVSGYSVVASRQNLGETPRPLRTLRPPDRVTPEGRTETRRGPLISTEGTIGPRAMHTTPEAQIRRDDRRVNPAGGLISGSQRNNLNASHIGSTPPIFGATSSRPDRQGKHTSPHGQADTHWELKEGVPPVIEPIRWEREIDTGPVIGIDQ
ncbi:hypothetical protein ACTMTJ_31180 [Phytohabitans sp. LJ34]|uniref:hypothetical protein n=1 Tax=Phytohabitans sp. LJ34 TaxID=3452217 RepID=UPI003F8C5C62